MQDQQAKQLITELRQQYPQAFKWTFLFYSQIKTKGILNERKEFIPWILALMIFIPLCVLIQQYVQQAMPTLTIFDAYTYAVLGILLFFMLVTPFIIWQIKHSSHSLYQLILHAPIKLTVLIILHTLNFAFLQSFFVLGMILFFGVSFGFVRFYKENLFRDETHTVQYFYLQEIRRGCYWAYKKSLCLKIKLWLKLHPKKAAKQLKIDLEQFARLHTDLLKLEHQYCKKIKHIDIDRYLDEAL